MLKVSFFLSILILNQKQLSGGFRGQARFQARRRHLQRRHDEQLPDRRRLRHRPLDVVARQGRRRHLRGELEEACGEPDEAAPRQEVVLRDTSGWDWITQVIRAHPDPNFTAFLLIYVK